MAEFRLDRFKFNWKGTWRSDVSYTKDDIVHYKGKSFVCLLGHTSTSDFYNEFNNDYVIEVSVTDSVNELPIDICVFLLNLLDFLKYLYFPRKIPLLFQVYLYLLNG